MKLYLLLFAWILVLTLVSTSYGLRICAFNIQKFGETKRNNAEVMNIIAKILTDIQCDVILIQEVLDKTQDSSATIAALKNRGLKGFTYVSSEELGTSRYKERYLFLIRENVGLTVEDRFQFQSNTVKFERPPFSIKLRSKRSDTKELKEFVLSAIHVKPDDKHIVTKREIRQLKDVHEELKRKWNTDNIIIMGDMNAGSRYITPEELAELPIAKAPFVWLPIDTDTTISCYDVCGETTGQAKGLYDRFRENACILSNQLTNYLYTVNSNAKKCPYDRFIITGDDLKKYLDPNKAGIFKFNEVYNLTPQQAKAVSDHYPIELLLDDQPNNKKEHRTEL